MILVIPLAVLTGEEACVQGPVILPKRRFYSAFFVKKDEPFHFTPVTDVGSVTGGPILTVSLYLPN